MTLASDSHLGLANAQSGLGKAHFRGEGMPQDDRQAAKWLRLAAEQGHATAQ
jgi:TPR repeat protein